MACQPPTNNEFAGTYDAFTFINIKEANPSLIINPDSVDITPHVTYTYNFIAKLVEFETMDGREWSQQYVKGYNHNTKARLKINGMYHMVYEPPKRQIFSFDIRFKLNTIEIVDYYFLFDPVSGTIEEKVDGTALDLAQIKSHLSSLSELNEMFSELGFNTGWASPASSIESLIQDIQWKFRTRLADKRYYGRAYFSTFFFDQSSSENIDNNLPDYAIFNKTGTNPSIWNWLLSIYPNLT